TARSPSTSGRSGEGCLGPRAHDRLAVAGPHRTPLDLVPRPQQPPLRRAAAATRADRRVPADAAERPRPTRPRLPCVHGDEAVAPTCSLRPSPPPLREPPGARLRPAATLAG